MEAAEDIRHTIGKQTDLSIKERNHRADFCTAKEQHGFRYTQYTGKSTDGNESRAYLRVHEFEEAGKNTENEAGIQLIFGFFKKNKKGIDY